jgi:peptide-methionine (R)-S-oxide reductase
MEWEVYLPMDGKIEKLDLSEAEWEERLTADEYDVLREAGTEPAFANEYYALKDPGVYCCGACGLPLFSSETKYESGTGWPSFWAPYAEKHVAIRSDYKLFYRRDEVLCARCDSHIGQVFEDGPPPTGERWCMNSLALRFVPLEEWHEETEGEE